MISVHCSYEVVAGLIPGQPMPEYTKQWHVPTGGDVDEAEDMAQAYAVALRQGNLNWVRLDYLLY